ncbi:MAG: hypothetical protein RLY61_966 [Candidatus Parcubacteria bacterium]|jgi:hypothetical protein
MSETPKVDHLTKTDEYERVRVEHEVMCHSWAGPKTSIRASQGTALLRLGIPAKGQATREILFPNDPHVFISDVLEVHDPSHRGGVQLGRTKLLIAHGVQTKQGWRFLNGQDVTHTLLIYNSFAKEYGVSPIEFIASCNEARAGTYPPMMPHINAIRIGEFGDERYTTVTYAIDDYVAVSGFIRPSGAVQTYIRADKPFFNLDKLLTSRQIKIK